MRRAVPSVLILMVLVSCVTLGIQAPETTEDKINYVSAGLKGLTVTVEQNLKADLITVDQAENYLERALGARNMISTARLALEQGDDADALAKWKVVNDLVFKLTQEFYTPGGDQ